MTSKARGIKPKESGVRQLVISSRRPEKEKTKEGKIQTNRRDPVLWERRQRMEYGEPPEEDAEKNVGEITSRREGKRAQENEGRDLPC